MSALPVVVVGGGPVGLAAAAHLVEEGLDPVVFEAGENVGASVGSWGHVRLFSPWRSNVDAAAARLLVRDGWTVPDLDALPTGRDLVDDYLVPLGRVPELRSRVRLRSRVISISRAVDKVTHDRHSAPFVVRFVTADGEDELLAARVVDASGTWLTPNPLGANGTPALGESQVRGRLHYGIPDVLGADRSRHAGRTTAVVGSGHSAANSVLALLALRQQSPTTEVHWLIRGTTLRALGGGSADQLVARGRLGSQVGNAVRAGVVQFHERFGVREVRAAGERIELVSDTGRLLEADQVVVATGQRPDRSLTQELRLDLDAALDSTTALAPLIDPNVHSCGTVRPHSYQALTHPEVGFFTAGAKSYGRAPTFLLATGYEQVRSIAAHLAGDEHRAQRVHLALPDSGACRVSDPARNPADAGVLAGAGSAGCCG